METNKGKPDMSGLVEWWEWLDDRSNRGARADLRHAKTVEEIFFCPAYHRLVERFPGASDGKKADLAVVAGVLAHVKENRTGAFAVQMATPKEGRQGNPVVSGLRFRRLLQAEKTVDLFQPLIRKVRLLGGVVDVADLALSILYWNDRTRRRWATEYYQHAQEAE